MAAKHLVLILSLATLCTASAQGPPVMKPSQYVTPASIRKTPDQYPDGYKLVTTGTPTARRDPDTNQWTGVVESFRFTMTEECKTYRDERARLGQPAYYNATIHRDVTGVWLSFDSPHRPPGG